MTNVESGQIGGKAWEIVRAHPFILGTAAIALLAVLFFWGCSEERSGVSTTSVSDEKRVQQHLLDGILDDINHLENESPFSGGEMVERLNQWLTPQRKLFESQPWTLDPLAAEAVPHRFTGHLGIVDFQPLDATAIWQAVCLNSVGNAIVGDRKLDDLTLATELFDWTVRNIQLQEDSNGQGRDTAWEALLHGQAEPLNRAAVFIGLCRQRNLDVVMLAYPNPEDDLVLKTWAPALWLNGELYVFEHELGLPIPGPGGKGVATLKQIVADDGLLRQLDIPGRFKYPVKSADLAAVTAMIEASPQFVARRFRILQNYLAGQKKIVLTMNLSSLAGELAVSGQFKRVKVWDWPYTCLENRIQQAGVDDPSFQVWMDEYEVNQVLLDLHAYERSSTLGHDITPPDIKKFVFGEKEDQVKTPEQLQAEERAKQFVKLVTATMWKGRMLQFKGGTANPNKVVDTGFSGDQNAAHYYQLSRLPQDEIESASKQLEDKIFDLERTAAELAANIRVAEDEVQVARLQSQARQMRYRLKAFELRGQYAAFWLGLVAYDRGDYEAAIRYFRDHTLKTYPGGVWERGARYNLARSLEAAGKLREALEVLDADASFQRHGSLLRARMLKEKISQSTATASAP